MMMPASASVPPLDKLPTTTVPIYLLDTHHVQEQTVDEKIIVTICRDVFRGEKLSLQVLDRAGARECVHKEAYGLISITDPQFVHPALCDDPCRLGVLRLTFSDVEERVARLRLPADQIVAFTPDLAQQVVGFVRQQMTQGTRLFVIHCEAGISRSAGVATALSRHYNQDESFFLLNYRPNRWVRKCLLESLEEEIDAR